MERINPRQILRRVVAKMEDARCPECGRAFDPVAAAEDYCPRIQPLHCRWCSDRLELISMYRAWLQQDAALQRPAGRSLRQPPSRPV
jgi:hypothetical protein